MSFDKAIEHGKEHRKPYRDSRAFDRHCRNHGDCDWCKGNRTHKFKKREPLKEKEEREDNESI